VVDAAMIRWLPGAVSPAAAHPWLRAMALAQGDEFSVAADPR
jgi:hypothetical protein